MSKKASDPVIKIGVPYKSDKPKIPIVGVTIRVVPASEPIPVNWKPK